jgi:protein involved in polysaccharide export with SLBB domain
MLRLIAFAVLLIAFPLPAVAQSGAGMPTDAVTLQPGDVIRVQVWREEDLSGEFLVDEDGIVTLPLLGERRVSDTPMRQLRDQLIGEYREQLRNPSITIVPLRRISVLGEVNKPGLYLADPTITLAGTIGLAEGTTPNGSMSRIRIVRNGQVIHSRAGAAQALNTIDVRSGDQIFVGSRSWLSRNAPYVISTALSVTTLIITLASR